MAIILNNKYQWLTIKKRCLISKSSTRKEDTIAEVLWHDFKRHLN